MKFIHYLYLTSASVLLSTPTLAAEQKMDTKSVYGTSCVFPRVKASSKMNVSFNLNSESTVPVNSFYPTDYTSYNYVIKLPVIDSLGREYEMAIYFIKIAANKWTMRIYHDNSLLGMRELSFASAGVLTSEKQFSLLIQHSNADAQTIEINIDCSTQYAAQNELMNYYTDGYADMMKAHHASKILNKIIHKKMCASYPIAATSLVKLNLNLDASAALPTHADFKMNDPYSYNYTHSLWVYDSFGAPYKLSLYYIKDYLNHWIVKAYMYDNELTQGSLTFNTQGHLTQVTGLDNLSWKPYSGAASPQTFSINMTCSTQYGGSSHLVEDIWQDGQGDTA